MDEMTMAGVALTAYAVPVALMLVALLVQLGVWQSVEQVFQVGRALTLGAVGWSLLAGGVVLMNGASVSPLIGIDEFGFTARLDALSLVMVWLVAFLGTFLIQFSRNYLDGDDRHAAFLGRLYMTIGAVLFFVVAGNVWQLFAGWVGMSVALHQLLLFYPERPRAVSAARKKFVVARLGDVVFFAAIMLLVSAFGTGDLAALSNVTAAALESGTIPLGASIAAVLIAVAAILKSAMFPFHGWLLEVMETPTPVSALLHAGLLNAGIFLIVRFGDLIFLSTGALSLLIIVGGFTALFASTAMITQSSVKVSLAYSSAAHMGFMLMLCGFGAHSVAIMHLVAHSFYKAHAFLSSGSIVDYVRTTGAQKLNTAPRPLTLLANLGVALSIFLGIGLVVGMELLDQPYEIALGAIFVIAITHLLVKGSVGSSPLYVMGRTAVSAAGVTLAFYGLELSAAWILGDSVAKAPTPNTVTLVVMGLAVVAFGVVTMLGSLLPALVHKPAWRAAYVHLKNGLYANTLFDRLMSSWR